MRNKIRKFSRAQRISTVMVAGNSRGDAAADVFSLR